MHASIWEEVQDEPFHLPTDKRLTLVAYECGLTTRAYIEPVAVDDVLPDMPLFLEPEGCVWVPLEATYQTAFQVMPVRWRTVLEVPPPPSIPGQADSSEARSCTEIHSDALVFFGATGDLAYKKIFPALQPDPARHLDVPIVGVAKSGWTVEELRRGRDSLEKHGGLDEPAFTKLAKQLRYVDGDYEDPATFEPWRSPGRRQRPSALPGHPAEPVRHRRGSSGEVRQRQAPGSWSRSRSAATWPPPRSSTASCTPFDEARIFRIDHYLGKEPVQNLLIFRFANLSSNRSGTATRRGHADHHGRELRRPGPRPFYDEAGPSAT